MTKRPDRRGKQPRPSPLYTHKDSELAKRQIIATKGRDTDGAYRARNRIDSKQATPNG